MFGAENFFFEEEEEGIDPERIINDDQHLANIFFCAICQGLLWKPKSCASCQHLFCKKCIQTWLQINPISCPFRCSPYEEKRAPPYIHSLFGRLSIRCRNHSFGCTEILSYDRLEQHENVECQFLTKRCRLCGIDILFNEIEQHQISCLPTTVQCFVCKCSVDRNTMSQHLTECLRHRLDLFIDEIIPTPDELGIAANDQVILPQEQMGGNWVNQLNYRLQRLRPAMPHINLIGVENVIQARRENIWRRLWTVVQLLWFNKSRAVQIIFLLTCFGIGFIVGCLMGFSVFLQNQVNRYFYRSFTLIIIFSGLFVFSLPYFLTLISDTSIIVSTISSLIFWSAACPKLSMDYFQIDLSLILLSVIYIIILIIFKLLLVVIRVYSSYIPAYLSAGCLAWMIIFITFHIRRFSINRT